ncbi:MAG: acyltransferase family protein [Micropruina sp.]|nr:hypothetical protein [Micropruina sp.]
MISSRADSPDSVAGTVVHRTERNHLIDAARTSSVVMVVLFHSVLFGVQIVDGMPVVTAWEPGPSWWPFSWLVMIVPVFFVAAGYADATAVDGMRSAGTDLAHYLARRGSRIVAPLVLFSTLVAALSTALAWQPGAPPALLYPGTSGLSWLELSTYVSRDYCYFLWFVAVYLLLLFLAPLTVTAQDRFGVLVLAVLGGLAAAFDQLSFALNEPQARSPNVFLVWAACHQVGIAYQRGWFRGGPRWLPIITLVGAGSGIAALIAVLDYPPAAVAFSDRGVANNLPPTVALALLAVAQASLLGILEQAGVMRTLSGRLARALRTANALTVNVYLWQSTGILITLQLLVWLGLAWPQTAMVALQPMVITLASVLVLAVIIPPISWLEGRLTPRLGAQQSLRAGVVAFLLLTAGTTIIWVFGAVLHPDRPWSSAGVLMIWTGAWLMIWAVDEPRAGSR